jgi:membrane-bound ClpP family serine protease
MPDVTVIAILYGVGLLLLVGDLFLPSHGLLTLASFGMLGYALYLTFQISDVAGLIGSVSLATGVPAILYYSVKVWHRTPIGRRISPPNPVLTEADRLPVADLKGLIGSTGRSVTSLRPVGTCIFDGRRVECVAEQEMITSNTPVEAVRLSDRSLVVRAVQQA